MRALIQMVGCMLLAGCAGQVDVRNDSGPPQPVNLQEDGSLQFPDLGATTPQPDTHPITLPQPDSMLAPASDMMHGPDGAPSHDTTKCAISCTSSCAAGVSSQCTWDCGAVKHKVSCSGPSGCSQYSYCSCYQNGALVKQGSYSISSAAGGINGALGQVRLEFCDFP